MSGARLNRFSFAGVAAMPGVPEPIQQQSDWPRATSGAMATVVVAVTAHHYYLANVPPGWLERRAVC